MKTCMPVLHLNEEGTSQTMKGCFLVIEDGRLSHQQQLGPQGTQQPADEEERHTSIAASAAVVCKFWQPLYPCTQHAALNIQGM